MKFNWIPLASTEDVDRLVQRSHEIPCLILKHSTRCQISSIAKYRLEDDWSFAEGEMEVYYLDLLRYREVSKYVAESLSVYHESPQVLLLMDGECVYDASHLDISVAELREVLETLANKTA
jgi:bacillithiol system protein YtxJ